jgi:hypothetical protein
VPRLRPLPSLDASTHRPHALHAETCTWPEKNCYVDVWIELLHALGLDPHAMLGSALTADFVDDQWTFFKPPHAELRSLYGIDVQELTVWRPLIDHAEEHLAQGRLVSTEADAFWLPDTEATDYRRNRVKTTIVLADLDRANERLGYFHNAGYFELQGEDFRGLFRLGDAASAPPELPLFAEWIDIARRIERPSPELAQRSLALWHEHRHWRPAHNPLQRFADRFERDLPQLVAAGLPHYHAWAFASVRQLGLAFELAAAHLRWLHAHEASPEGATAAAEAFAEIGAGAKTLILKVARMVNTRRPGDVRALFETLAHAWDRAFAALAA